MFTRLLGQAGRFSLGPIGRNGYGSERIHPEFGQRDMRIQWCFSGWAVTVALALTGSVSADVTIDGSVAGDNYGQPVALQTVQTGFGDNQSELNALYARVDDGQLYLALTGNLEANGNRIYLFFDTEAGGMNPVIRPASALDDLTFDAGFAPDYFTVALSRRDAFDLGHFVLDSDIRTGVDWFADVFEGDETGAIETPMGEFFGVSFGVGFDNSNEAGVTGGEEVRGAADPNAAAAVQTGVELRIPLSAIGNPTGEVRMLAGLAGAFGNFFSNQFLPGLQPPQENLGSDGLGNSLATLGLLDFNDFAGQQFLTIPIEPVLVGDFDGSGLVEQGDLDLVLQNWGGDPWSLGDAWLNHRPYFGLVDQDELDIVLQNWGSTTPPINGTPVPEPAVAAIALPSLLIWWRRR